MAPKHFPHQRCIPAPERHRTTKLDQGFQVFILTLGTPNNGNKGWEIFTVYFAIYIYILTCKDVCMKILMNLGKIANLSSGCICMNVYKQFSPRINHSDIKHMFDMDST